jgi:serine/threonine protein kinase
MEKIWKRKYLKYNQKAGYINTMNDDDIFINNKPEKIIKNKEESQYICCIENIGKGSFGKITTAFDNINGKVIIIKSITNNTPSIITKIDNEIDIQRKLHNHINIIQIYDYIKTKSSINIIMENVGGTSLDKLCLFVDGFDINLIFKYLIQICRTLNYIHFKNIIHYDIKAANILLCNNGNIKIIDFGESEEIKPNEIKQNSKEFKTAGTFLFMAPEALFNNIINIHNIGCVDVWSIGVMLVELFCGKINMYDYIYPLTSVRLYQYTKKNNINTYHNDVLNVLSKNLYQKIDKLNNSNDKKEKYVYFNDSDEELKKNDNDEYIKYSYGPQNDTIIFNNDKYTQDKKNNNLTILLSLIKRCLILDCNERITLTQILKELKDLKLY